MKTKPHLDYLFRADFADGTTYHQGSDDESLLHPKDAEGNGPSAYRDVLDRINEVVRFHLVGNGNTYTVDLTAGHFEVNGVPFKIERPDVPLTDIRLTYCHFTNVESTVEATVGKNGLFDWRGAKEVARSHYVARYVMGFTAMQGGKEVEYTISIEGG